MPRGIKGSLTFRLKGYKDVPKAVLKDTLQYAKGITPIDTGYARRHTFADYARQAIIAKYHYARYILLNGHSKQLAAGAFIPAIQGFFKSRAAETFKYWKNRRR